MQKYVDEFPKHWLEDPDILYHGTSNIFEADIDREGLRTVSLLDDRISSVIVDIYKNTLFSFFDSSHGGGIDVIVPYYKNEISRFGSRPLSFAFHPSRCTLYASRDFAGGEHIRSLYRAISYYKELLLSKNKRSAWENEFKQMLMNMPPEAKYHDKLSINNPSFPLAELENKYSGIADSLTFCHDIISKYEYGVIYAVDLSDFPTSRVSKEAKGLYVHDTIPTKMIAGKIIWTQGNQSIHGDNDHYFSRFKYWKNRLSESL
jgi:hypothetical protein